MIDFFLGFEKDLILEKTEMASARIYRNPFSVLLAISRWGRRQCSDGESIGQCSQLHKHSNDAVAWLNAERGQQGKICL